MTRFLSVFTIVLTLLPAAKAQAQLSGSWLSVRTLATVPPGAIDTVYSSTARVLTLSADHQSVRGVEYTLLRIPEGAWARVPDGYETARVHSGSGTLHTESTGNFWATLVLEGEDGESTSYRVTLTEEGTRLELVRSDDPAGGMRSYRRIPSLLPPE